MNICFSVPPAFDIARRSGFFIVCMAGAAAGQTCVHSGWKRTNDLLYRGSIKLEPYIDYFARRVKENVLFVAPVIYGYNYFERENKETEA